MYVEVHAWKLSILFVRFDAKYSTITDRKRSLSILFVRFIDMGGEFKWYSIHPLSILFVRFILTTFASLGLATHFQFSLWDSKVPCFKVWAVVGVHLSILFVRFWNFAAPHRPQPWKSLSILFVRFYRWGSPVKDGLVLLSILFVRFFLCTQTRPHWQNILTFNSLCEIQNRPIRLPGFNPIVDFQFSLWDSNRLESTLRPPFFKLSILFVRFFRGKAFSRRFIQ